MYWFVIDTRKTQHPDEIGYCLSAHGSESDAEAAAIPLRYDLDAPSNIQVIEADYQRLRNGFLKKEAIEETALKGTGPGPKSAIRQFAYFPAISKTQTRLAPVVHAVLPEGFVSSRLIRTPNEYLCGGKIFDPSRSMRVPGEPVTCPRCRMKLQALHATLQEASF